MLFYVFRSRLQAVWSNVVCTSWHKKIVLIALADPGPLPPTPRFGGPTVQFGGPSVQFKSKIINFRALIFYFVQKNFQPHFTWHEYYIFFTFFNSHSAHYFILCAYFYIMLTQVITFLSVKIEVKYFCIHYCTKMYEELIHIFMQYYFEISTKKFS